MRRALSLAHTLRIALEYHGATVVREAQSGLSPFLLSRVSWLPLAAMPASPLSRERWSLSGWDTTTVTEVMASEIHLRTCFRVCCRPHCCRNLFAVHASHPGRRLSCSCLGPHQETIHRWSDGWRAGQSEGSNMVSHGVCMKTQRSAVRHNHNGCGTLARPPRLSER